MKFTVVAAIVLMISGIARAESFVNVPAPKHEQASCVARLGWGSTHVSLDTSVMYGQDVKDGQVNTATATPARLVLTKNGADSYSFSMTINSPIPQFIAIDNLTVPEAADLGAALPGEVMGKTVLEISNLIVLSCAKGH